MATASGHGDRKGRHYYTTHLRVLRPCIVVATLAVAMLSAVVAMLSASDFRNVLNLENNLYTFTPKSGMIGSTGTTIHLFW